MEPLTPKKWLDMLKLLGRGGFGSKVRSTFLFVYELLSGHVVVSETDKTSFFTLLDDKTTMDLREVGSLIACFVEGPMKENDDDEPQSSSGDEKKAPKSHNFLLKLLRLLEANPTLCSTLPELPKQFQEQVCIRQVDRNVGNALAVVEQHRPRMQTTYQALPSVVEQHQLVNAMMNDRQS